jgi:hypothetical protein
LKKIRFQTFIAGLAASFIKEVSLCPAVVGQRGCGIQKRRSGLVIESLDFWRSAMAALKIYYGGDDSRMRADREDRIP